MFIKEGKKVREPVTDGIRSKKKGKNKNFSVSKYYTLEEKVSKEKVGSFKNMDSIAS